MSEFVVTNAGLAAAAASSPTGPFIEIVAFKLGSNATTVPLATDTGLAGTTVFSGVPSSYSYYDPTTVQINCEVPASAGPFAYGEVGLYLPGNVLFARFSYGVLRNKVASSTSGYANTLRIKALIRLVQGPTVFNFDPDTIQTILEVSSLQVLQTPFDNPENPVVIVHEPNDFQDSLLCYKHSATLWGIANYSKIGTATVTAASDSTHLTATYFSTLYLPASNLGKYVIQTAGGYMRTISGLSGNIATLASSINTSALIGQTVSVYQFNTSRFAEMNAAVTSAQAAVSSLNLDFYLGNATLVGTAYTATNSTVNNPTEIFSVKFLSANPASATLNINGTGARALRNPAGDALPAGEITAGDVRVIVFDGSEYYVQEKVGTKISQGTFNFDVKFGGNNAGMTYSLRDGRWFRSGSMVTYIMYVVLSNKGSSTGNASITGLPFTSVGTLPGDMLVDLMSGLTGPPQCLVLSGTTTMELRQFDGSTGSPTYLTHANFNNNTLMHLRVHIQI